MGPLNRWVGEVGERMGTCTCPLLFRESVVAKLYFYYSAMNAGKSTTLLQSAHNYKERGMTPLLLTPRLDSRNGVGKITSRIGLEAAARIFDGEEDLYTLVMKERIESSLDCVLIDESQFLTAEQVLQLTVVVDNLFIPVLCYGIRTDFRGEPFEGSKYLLAWADELNEIKTVCASGKKATFNARLDAEGQRVYEGEQVDVGHHYISMSRASFDLPRLWKKQ